MNTSAITGIIDYGVGNVRSVENAIEALGKQALLTSDHTELLECDRLILPGVGAYAHGMKELKSRGLDEVIAEVIRRQTPLLGICLGMQMLTSYSEEFGKTDGLQLVDGFVKQMRSQSSTDTFRLPHVAWKQITQKSNKTDWLFEGVNPQAQFYFIHSYAVSETSSDTVATAFHDAVEFAAVIASGNVIGTQFHPEKSGPEGLKLLNNFLSKGH